MNISDRIFTYPILNEDKDDYADSSFDVDFSYKKENISTVTLNFTFKLDCDEIQSLIDEHKAKFAVHFECSATSFRIVQTTEFSSLSFTIPINKLNGKLEMTAFVITNDYVFNYTSSDLIEDYQGIQFDIPKHSLLAYKNLSTLEFVKNYNEFQKGDSIFCIYKRLTVKDEPMCVDIDSDKIRLGIGETQFNFYTNINGRPEFQKLFNSLTVLPALVYVFEELRFNGAIEIYRNRGWYKALKNSYSKRGIDFEDLLFDEDKTAIDLAQYAMELPINDALEQMRTLSDGNIGGR